MIFSSALHSQIFSYVMALGALILSTWTQYWTQDTTTTKWKTLKAPNPWSKYTTIWLVLLYNFSRPDKYNSTIYCRSHPKPDKMIWFLKIWPFDNGSITVVKLCPLGGAAIYVKHLLRAAQSSWAKNLKFPYLCLCTTNKQFKNTFLILNFFDKFQYAFDA